jgi:mono/diheme cytochrome c family protein
MRLLSPLVVLSLLWLAILAGQAPADAGRKIFTEQCAPCHGVDAAGGTFATSILPRIATLDDAALEAAIRSGVPARGMPGFALKPSEMTAVVAYLRTLRAPTARGRRDRLEPLHAETTTGEVIDGLVIRQSFGTTSSRRTMSGTGTGRRRSR